ncbi:hypothetical protein [Corynebacterium kutscheri]|uniref:Uncharacterized protein n=1 Tax=Corynebacterium kutscheri TaxID=35755 RepID=A0AB38VRN2_9CORY|nr:hypothetical protein [Corynebacterium kutscheri]VEH06486.1 Uncharacterised protein [Corynebacterium kutscheri]
MGKWLHQAQEIERLRRENQRLVATLAQLKIHLGDEASDIDPYGVSAEELRLAYLGPENRRYQGLPRANWRRPLNRQERHRFCALVCKNSRGLPLSIIFTRCLEAMARFSITLAN